MQKLTQKFALTLSQGEQVVTVREGATPTLVVETIHEVPKILANVLNFIASGCLRVRVFLQPMRTVDEFNEVERLLLELLFKIPRSGEVRVSTILETREDRSPEKNVAEGSARILTIAVDHADVFN